MDEFITLTEYNWAFWVAGLFALANFFRWIFISCEAFFNVINKMLKFFGIKIKTKKMLQREEYEKRLKQVEDSIEEIKNTSKHNVEMFIDHEHHVVGKFTGIKDEIVKELNKLHDNINEQQEEMENTKKANDKTDCAMLRDRISSGMRYFSKNVDADGKVHIAFSDYVNMDALFQEYFVHGGNGVFEKMYEDEFVHFIIDR